MIRIKFLVVLVLLVLGAANNCIAQSSSNEIDSIQHYGFDKHKLFAGGSLNLGYGGGSVSNFAIGILPEIGYSVKEWLDAGFAFSLNYYSSTEFHDPSGVYSSAGYKATSYGAGIFARIHPIEGYFIQVQPEFNHYNIKETYSGDPTYPKSYSQTSTSVLVGIGWGRRIIGESSFFTTLMVDLGKEKLTPYKDSQGNLIPVIRTGFNFYF